MKIAGTLLKALLLALFAFSASGKIFGSPEVQTGFARFGLGYGLMFPIGALELISVIVYVVPTRLEIIGAILLTGYMGGAVVTHLRVGDKPALQIIIAILIWVAYFLRNPALARQLFFSDKK
jgi:hypothetical protein